MSRANLSRTLGHCRWAFTLVELLVVIGIISVLLAILLPSLSRARQSANSVACQSNLRQIAMWGLMYADTWRGVLPHNGTTDFVNGVGYFHLSTTVWSDKYINEMLSGRYSRNGGTVMHCPEAMAAISYMRNHNSAACTYGLNYYLGGDWRERRSCDSQWPDEKRRLVLHAQRAEAARSEVRQVLVRRCKGLVLPGLVVRQPPRHDLEKRKPLPMALSADQAFRRSAVPGDTPTSSTNFAFGDGHVESIPYKEFLATYYAAPPNLSAQAWMNFTGAPAGYPPDSY